MKRVVFVVLFISFIYANNKNEKSKYLEFTNKIINYNFQIKDINKIKSPFYMKKLYIQKHNKKLDYNNLNSLIKKRIDILLLAIFENKAYIKINKYIGEELVSTKKEWIKINDYVANCKLVKLTYTDAYFNCKNKKLHKTLNKKILNLGDKK